MLTSDFQSPKLPECRALSLLVESMQAESVDRVVYLEPLRWDSVARVILIRLTGGVGGVEGNGFRITYSFEVCFGTAGAPPSGR